MTIETRLNRHRYIGNGSTKTFAFSFRIWKNDQIKVFVGNGRSETDMTPFVSVSRTASGGSVTFPSAPQSGQVIVIRRNMPYIQEDDYRNGTRFDSEEIEDRFDQDCAERQDLLLGLERSIKLPETSSGTADSLVQDLMQARDDVLWALETAGEVTGASRVTARGTTAPRALQDRFADVVNVKDFGAKGDGLTDDTDAIQAAFDYCGSSSVAWFPPGTYVVSGLQCSCSVFGNGINSSIIKGTEDSGCVIEWLGDYDHRELFGVKIVAHDGQNGLCCKGTGRINMHDFYVVLEGAGAGIVSNPSRTISRFIVASNFAVLGLRTDVETYGMDISGASDSRLSNFEIMRVRKGIYLRATTSYIMMSDFHIYCGCYTPSSQVSWWNGTVGIQIHTTCVIHAVNCYIDTTCVAVGLDSERAAVFSATNFIYWDDGAYGSDVNKSTLLYQTTYYDSTLFIINGARIGATRNLAHLYNERRGIRFINAKFVLPASFDGVFSASNDALPKSSDCEDSKVVVRVEGEGYTPIAYVRTRYAGFVQFAVSDSGGTSGTLTVSAGPVFKWEPTDGTNNRLWYEYDSSTYVATVYVEHYETRLIHIEIQYSGETNYIFRHDLIEVGDTKVAFVPEKLDNADSLTHITAS